MGLQDLFETKYGSGSEEATKEAAEVSQIEKQLEGFTDEEVTRLQAAGGLLDSYGYEFEDGQQKLAAAAELLDAIEVPAEEGGEEAAADAGTETTAEGDDDNIVVTEDGKVFKYLGTEQELTQTQEDEKTAADAEAQGRFMAQGFHAELATLQS